MSYFEWLYAPCGIMTDLHTSSTALCEQFWGTSCSGKDRFYCERQQQEVWSLLPPFNVMRPF